VKHVSTDVNRGRLRAILALALALMLPPVPACAVDVVVDLGDSPAADIQDQLNKDYGLAEIRRLADFGLFTLRLNNPSDVQAQALVDKLRGDSRVQHADLAPANDAALFRNKVADDALPAQQLKTLDDARKFAPNAYVVQARDLEILRKLLAGAFRTTSTGKDGAVIEISPELKLGAVTTFYQVTGDRTSWNAVVLKDPAAAKPEPIGTVALSIFANKNSKFPRIWGRITRGDEVILVRPLADQGLQLVLPSRRNPRHVREDLPGPRERAPPGVPPARPPSPPSPSPPPRPSPPPCPPGVACAEPASPIAVCREPEASAPTITVGVLLRKSESPGQAVVNLDEFAAHVIEEMNSAFRCSGVEARVKLSKVEEREFGEPSTLDDYLEAFSGCEQTPTADGCLLNAIYQWRSDSSSNVVLVLSREMQNPFAAGYTGGRAFAVIPATAAQTYSEGSYEYDADLIALHELGHVFGGRHDLKWYSDNYRNLGNEAQFVLNRENGHAFYQPPTAAGTSTSCTIMAQSDCHRELYFSSPRVELSGIRMGSSGSEDVALVISQRAAEICTFK
jgi:hypothetical protein